MEKQNKKTDQPGETNLLTEHKKKNRKRNIIILVVGILVLVALIGKGIYSLAKGLSSLGQSLASSRQTEEVTVRDLVRSVGATGTIVAVDSEDVTSELTGLKFETVSVKVGDIVKAGDVIATFETADLEESLADARESLEIAKELNDLTSASASAGLASTKRSGQESVADASAAVTEAYESFTKANDTFVTLKKDYDSKKSATDAAQKAMADAKSLMEAARAEAESDAVTGNDALTASAAYQSAYTSYELAMTAYSAAKTASDLAADKANAQAEAAQELYKTYEKLKTTYDRTVASADSALASARNSNAQTSLGLTTQSQEAQVENYEKQLSKTILTAPIGGIVTAVNYREGDTYTTGPIATIRDVSSYEIRSYISEYDISDIALGQKVLIRTNATGEDQLQGTVTFISPTAAATTGSISYEVRISLDTPNDRLRLDMSASLSVILEEHEEALTVPYNAIQTGEDGEVFVQVEEEDGSLRDVPVTVLMETSYYTEISGEGIREGDSVVVIQSQSGMDDLMNIYF